MEAFKTIITFSIIIILVILLVVYSYIRKTKQKNKRAFIKTKYNLDI